MVKKDTRFLTREEDSNLFVFNSVSNSLRVEKSRVNTRGFFTFQLGVKLNPDRLSQGRRKHSKSRGGTFIQGHPLNQNLATLKTWQRGTLPDNL